MRPTEIKGMQLAHQKTPAPYNPSVTVNGTKLGFQTASLNQKCFERGNCLDTEPRFR